MIPHLTAAGLAGEPRVRHGFFGRRGGVSAGIFASLNAGAGSSDDPAAVAENRARIAGALDIAADRLVFVHQVHSGRAVLTEGPFAAARPEADAMATRTPGLGLAILTADCAPVLLADAEASVIGAAHAGWRGAACGVLEACVAAMTSLGAAPARIAAAIGPTIQQASYEVGPDLQAAVLERHPDAGGLFTPGLGDRLQFDLPGFAALRLAAAGVGRIETSVADTCSDDEAFFSHRRARRAGHGDYGRNCAVIALRAI